MNHISERPHLYICAGNVDDPATRAVSRALSVTDQVRCRRAHLNLVDLAQDMAGLGSFYLGIGEMRDAVGAYGVAGRRRRDHIAARRGALAPLIGRRFIISAGQAGYGVVSPPGGKPSLLTLDEPARRGL